MILDSPLSNVGHDSADQEFRDQQIVNAFYVLLADLDALFKNARLLVCDNRPPSTADSMVIVRFTGDEGSGRVGLVGKESEPAGPPAKPVTTEPSSDPQKAADSGESADPSSSED
jgi:hypothetical protein